MTQARRRTVPGLAVTSALALVTGCSVAPPWREPPPSPSETPPPRYAPVGEDFCAQAQLHKVPVRLGLTNGQLAEPEGYWDYREGQSHTGASGWRWWSAACGYTAYAGEDDRRSFTPRGTVIVRVFSAPEPAQDYYVDEIGKLAEYEPLGVAAPVDGWWDEGIWHWVRHTDGLGSPRLPFMTIDYHLYHDNLYMCVPLATETYRHGDTDRVRGRSLELLEALISEAIKHVPLAVAG